MTAYRIATPAAAPLAPDDVRRHLRVDGTELDDELAMLLGTVTAAAESSCRRAWMAQTWRQACAGEWRIELARGPVLSVVRVADDRGELTAGVDYSTRISGDDASVDPLGAGWHGEVTVDYRAGYAEPDPAADPIADAARCRAAVPEPVRWWLLARCRELYDGSAVADSALLAPYVRYRC